MNIIIDGGREFRPAEAPDNIITAIIQVEEHLRAQGRGILRLKINGVDIAPDELDENIDDSAPLESKVIEVQTEALGVLAKQTIDEMREVLPELATVCHQLAEVFQGGSPEEGFDEFNLLAEIWQKLKEGQEQIAHAIGVDLGAIDIGGRRLSDHHAELNKFLMESVDALEARDCVLLGDLLEYELAPRAEFEVNILDVLRSSLREHAG